MAFVAGEAFPAQGGSKVASTLAGDGLDPLQCQLLKMMGKWNYIYIFSGKMKNTRTICHWVVWLQPLQNTDMKICQKCTESRDLRELLARLRLLLPIPLKPERKDPKARPQPEGDRRTPRHREQRLVGKNKKKSIFPGENGNCKNLLALVLRAFYLEPWEKQHIQKQRAAIQCLDL